MTKPFLRVALTGGIATGKSYCLARFSGLGVPTVDADALARAAVAPGTPGLASVLRHFGPSVRRPDGELDRGALARIVFDDEKARRDLEAMVHPFVYRAISRRLTEWQNQPGCRFGMADVPLLFETKKEREFDCVVATWCRPEQQLERLLERFSLSLREAHQRIASQLPPEEKKRRADLVIDTTGSFADTDRQVAELVRTGFARPAPAE